MSDLFISFIAILIASVALLLLGIGVLLILRMNRMRRMNRLAVRPRLIPSRADHMPEGFRTFLGELTRSLQAIGFIAVANVQSPNFGAGRYWLQVVFARYETCDRVSCLCSIHAKRAVVTYIFATTASDGIEVKTTVGAAKSTDASFPTDQPLSSPQAVSAAYQAHRARVAAQLQGKPLIPTPPEGNEVPWLAAKLAEVTKLMADRRQFTLSFDRQWYVPNWQRAFVMAMESFFKKEGSRGFAVMPTGPGDISPSSPPSP